MWQPGWMYLPERSGEDYTMPANDCASYYPPTDHRKEISMSEDFVRDVLREHAEGDMPPVKDPWPAVRDKVQASHLAQKARSSPGPITSQSIGPEVQRTTPSPARSRFRVSTAAAMIALLALATGVIALLDLNGPGSNLATSPAPGCWGLVPNPNIGGGDSVLISLASRSSNDVWAVGYSSSAAAAQTLVQHWNGVQWSIVASANVPSSKNYLMGVVALSPADVWAVGYHCKENCVDDTNPSLQHWDGNTWSIEATPGKGRLNGIAAVSHDDIWAVGYNGNRPLIMHWDGRQWSEAPTNDPPLRNRSIQLRAAAGISAKDVWAVGEEYDPTNKQYSGAIYHWDGTLWGRISDSGDTGGDRLYAVAATSANDIWAAGEKGNSAVDEQQLQTITKHWDGARWLEVPSPNSGTGDSYLRGVSAISPGDVWAVGGYGPRTGTKQTLVMHWDGRHWQVVPSPNVERQSNRFFDVEAISANEIWAVGTYNRTSTGAFIERYENSCTDASPILPVPVVPDIEDPTALPGFEVEQPTK